MVGQVHKGAFGDHQDREDVHFLKIKKIHAIMVSPEHRSVCTLTLDLPGQDPYVWPFSQTYSTVFTRMWAATLYPFKYPALYR